MPVKRKGVKKAKKVMTKAQLNALHRRLGTPHGTRMHHPQHGGGFWDKLKGAWNWLRDTKVISSVAKVIPYAPVQAIGAVAGQMGLGQEGGFHPHLGIMPQPKLVAF